MFFRHPHRVSLHVVFFDRFGDELHVEATAGGGALRDGHDSRRRGSIAGHTLDKCVRSYTDLSQWLITSREGVASLLKVRGLTQAPPTVYTVLVAIATCPDFYVRLRGLAATVGGRV